ncbi:unnamed protein product [Cyprideis torosa]|uniref:Uncharacterized protein n=1 Tax=Cyprideis torosa TaxID=163714 RepID=A0A7R8W733_9CRUS|nr:unnamed protein product [Cyprideis torosa]CAG0881749.1 unnamed protein product [Cyprideis torosa]
MEKKLRTKPFGFIIRVYLSMLWNFNTKVRIEALEALLGYAKSVPEEVLPSLGSLLERAGPLLCNEEAKIRHLAAELLRAVTQKLYIELKQQIESQLEVPHLKGMRINF